MGVCSNLRGWKRLSDWSCTLGLGRRPPQLPTLDPLPSTLGVGAVTAAGLDCCLCHAVS